MLAAVLRVVKVSLNIRHVVLALTYNLSLTKQMTFCLLRVHRHQGPISGTSTAKPGAQFSYLIYEVASAYDRPELIVSSEAYLR